MYRRRRKKTDTKKTVVVAGYFTSKELQNIEKISKELGISCSELMRQSVIMLYDFVQRTGYFPVTGPYIESSGKKAHQLSFRIDENMEKMLKKLSWLLNKASYSFLIRTAVLFYVKEKNKNVD